MALDIPWLGTHVSIAGGVEKAPERGGALACESIQLFTKNNTRWKWPRLRREAASQFREGLSVHGIRVAFSHAIYLINLASPDRIIHERSIRAMLDEVRRAEILGLSFVVVHPGSHRGKGREEGIIRIIRALNRVFRMSSGCNKKILLENTAGGKNLIGGRFQDLGAILCGIDYPERIGFCFDTCHAFTAGYDFSARLGYERTIKELDEAVGLERVLAFHLNDSKHRSGSRLDRHEHIGRGKIGLEGFRLLLNDSRFMGRPMVLETPKSPDFHEDEENLAVLRGLLQNPGRLA